MDTEEDKIHPTLLWKVSELEAMHKAKPAWSDCWGFAIKIINGGKEVVIKKDDPCECGYCK